MSALGIRQKRMALPLPKAALKMTAKSRLNITNKFEAQVSQETILEAETDELIDIEEYTEEEGFADEDNDREQLIEYSTDEIDIDDDGTFGNEIRESVFDSSDDEVFHNIKPDIVIEEVVSTGGIANADLSVNVPSKVRSLTGTASREHEIRTDALERIGKFLAEQDEGFLLNDDFDTTLITAKKQKDIARLVGKDETWITRLKQSCIVQTPRWGLQPLFLFFPEELPASVISYSESIVRQISNEDPLNPITIEKLAELVSQGSSEYKSLTSNAGSKLRRLLERLSIPTPNERLKLARSITDFLKAYEGESDAEMMHLLQMAGNDGLDKLLTRYGSFSSNLLRRLRHGKTKR